MVVTMIGTFLSGWALDVAKQKAGATLDHRLNPSAVERALKQAVGTAEKEVPELFAPYEKDGLQGIDRFLNNAFKETAVTELQKPLQNQGKPDSALLTKVFLREAESHSVLNGLQSNLVEAWMRAFTEAYFQETNSFLSFQVTKEAYYKQLRAKIGKVVFSGMAIDGTVVDEPGDLARIFVMPDVQRQSSKRYEIAEPPSVEIASDEQKLIQWEQRQQLLLMKGQATDQRTISAVELLNEGGGQRVVLLGAPGAGKTTLINYLVVTAVSEQAEEKAAADSSAVSFGRHFPVLIRIRDLARSPDLSVLEFLTQFAENDLGVDGIPAGFFQHWLKTGEALILLDGLDEVADNTQRRKVVEKIETFLGACDRCPTLITSRPAGYRDDYFSRDQYPHYELLPFDDAKIETFINHWYDSRVDLETERERRKGSLRKALSNQPRIKQLARNPLLLTIIAVIHRYKTLPKQRHELYHSAVETLISTWDEDKELTIRPVLKHLDIRDIRRLMKQLAYWIHTQGSVEDAENGTQIARGDLIRQLGEFIREMKASEKLKRYQATEEAEAFLDKIIRDRAGLLSQQGQNRYAFVHKTFQEYLCSQEILYLQEDQDPDDDDYVPHTKNHIQKHLHDPHWREVLLLLVAQQAPTPAKASLKTILKADSEYEQWLHRDLLFAGSCLAENAEIADRATIDQILTELVNLEIRSQPLTYIVHRDKVRREVFRVISSLQDTPFAPMAMKLLEKYQQIIGQRRFIKYQEELEPDKAIQRLLLLSEDSDSGVRYEAVGSLAELDNPTEAVVSRLLFLLKDSHSDIRSIAAASLAGLNNPSEIAISELLLLLKDSNSDIRLIAAASLGQLNSSSEDVVSELLLLLKDSESDVLSIAAESLGQLSNPSEAVISELLLLLKNENSYVRSIGAGSLAKLSNPSRAVISELLLLIKDIDLDVRSSAAKSLAKLGNSSEAVISELLLLLKNENSYVRSIGAESLAWLENPSEAVISELLLLIKDIDLDVRFCAAKSLAQLGISSEAVVSELLLLLRYDHSYVRSHAAESLTRLGISSEAVVSELLLLLKDDSSSVSSRAAQSSARLSNPSNAVISELLLLLKDGKPSLVLSATDSLSSLGKRSDAVKPALVRWIERHRNEIFVGGGIDVLWELTN